MHCTLLADVVAMKLKQPKLAAKCPPKLVSCTCLLIEIDVTRVGGTDYKVDIEAQKYLRNSNEKN